MRKRVICIVISLLIMIPAGLSFAGSGLLSGFPSSATAGDTVSYTIRPADETVTDAEITVSPSSGASISASGLSFTIAFSEAGTYTIHAKAGDESDSCSITVSEAEGSSEEPVDEPSGETSDDTSVDTSDDTSKDTSSETTSDSLHGNQKERKEAQSPGADKGKGAVAGRKGASTGAKTGSGGSTSESKTTYQGSWDNYLDSLSVNGYEFTQDFHKTRNTYFITAGAEVSSIDVDAEPSDDSATVVVTGADELSAGRNKVMVSVTADNGDVRVYRIYVDIR